VLTKNARNPGKIIERNLCFICSLRTSNKVYIFGKFSIDFPEIIKSSIDVDVNSYYTDPDLFIRKPNCYKKLAKFQRASQHLEEVKREKRQESNNKFYRTMRLRIAQRQQQQVKMKKMLNFTGRQIQKRYK
jgi:hypothetical protein